MQIVPYSTVFLAMSIISLETDVRQPVCDGGRGQSKQHQQPPPQTTAPWTPPCVASPSRDQKEPQSREREALQGGRGRDTPQHPSEPWARLLDLSPPLCHWQWMEHISFMHRKTAGQS